MSPGKDSSIGIGRSMLSPIEVSPTEPLVYRNYGKIITSRPESFGVDFLWEANQEIWGVQRKRTDDFLNSYVDGRLSKESYQAQDLTQAILIIEGVFQFSSSSGQLLERGKAGRLTRLSIQKMLFTLQAKDGWNILTVKDSGEFGTMLYSLYGGSEKFEERASQRRERNRSQTSLERLLQSIDGVGARRARLIAQRHPGAVRLNITPDELLAIPGIGKDTVRRIFSELQS